MQHTAYLDDQVFTLSNVLSSEECARLIAFSEGVGYGPAPITTAFGFILNPEVRNNTRVMLDDWDRAAWLWDRIRSSVPRRDGWEAVGLNERLRFYRYEAGQAFRWHHDGFFGRDDDERSFLTCMVYLNDDFVGGETEFEPAPGIPESRFGVRPQTGSILLFDHPLRHQGAELVAGTKYVLRTDVMYRRAH